MTNPQIAQFPYSLDPSTFQGTVDGIYMTWNQNGQTNLSSDSAKLSVRAGALKAATEHVAHACAKRLRKNRVRIL